ncbi:polysaccharide biosynthesis protein [Candidatus Woesearchaeota archaeon]|nr:polysaccharide biosynthesis protein [Candidatus Woesearchaeota archaeon]
MVLKKGFLDGARILITGGSGSWGNELVKQILEKHDPKEIRIYSRGEMNQVRMKRRFHGEKCLKFVIGDVRDRDKLQTAMIKVDYVFHMAALKHVPVCEENAWESVLTNVVGTQNVIDTAIVANVKKVIDISTDKAVDPFNLYGTCKAVGEKLMIAANQHDTDTAFVCVRGGNVLGTSGSVVPLFRDQILKTGSITITSQDMTRFMMSLPEAINLIFEATKSSVGGEIFVMKMPALELIDLAEVMIEELGPHWKKAVANTGSKAGDINIKQIGIRPGEKMHEVLVSRYETPNCIERGPYHIILPNIKFAAIEEKYADMSRTGLDEFNSLNAQRLSKKDIKEMLDKEGWLSPTYKHHQLLKDLNAEQLLKFQESEGWKPRGSK